MESEIIVGKKERVFEHPLVEQERGTRFGFLPLIAILGIVGVMVWRLVGHDDSA